MGGQGTRGDVVVIEDVLALKYEDKMQWWMKNAMEMKYKMQNVKEKHVKWISLFI